MICIEIEKTGECLRIGCPVWITANRNGLLRTSHRVKALGVGDGEQIWSLGSLDGYPKARIISLAEYLAKQKPLEPDQMLPPEEALNIISGGAYETE